MSLGFPPRPVTSLVAVLSVAIGCLSGCVAPSDPAPRAGTGRPSIPSPAEFAGQGRAGSYRVAKGAELLQPPASATSTNPPRSRSGVLTPVERITGRVTAFNAQAQFAIVDFSFNALPAPGQFLEVHRGGRLVGRVRCSRWSQAGFAAADLIEGEAQPGDEIHGRVEPSEP
ncbi:MAG: hypothetical protein ACYDC1_05220 [Limisphaerales bacterium]